MTKQYRIQLRGKQREQIDADLVARLVVMLGSQLAEDAGRAITAEREAQEADMETSQEPYSKPGEQGRRTA